eukprot:CAMPEP_0204308844 /NCGR_PEP_ID=MMETSP0469-20131031/747_1 /ASSEMBLY_ACC=CAM_ASM_000384 /TAXON_ID=2969 /ORGANISM="Oxyrrhis marina" /LENGTH=212 /DNA_ID=CAMNT_0051288389 /DNA_START=105 /DNA_END=743 /DNA_ORIENTATION=-
MSGRSGNVRVCGRGLKHFRKTKLCEDFMKTGSCTKGKQCKFAHGESELRIAPNLEKTKLCAAFEEHGHCEKGASCQFAHGSQELRVTDMCYKSKLCKYFAKGTCEAGAQCCYAHGEHELRKAQDSKEASDSASTVGPETSCQSSDLGEESMERESVPQMQERDSFQMYTMCPVMMPMMAPAPVAWGPMFVAQWTAGISEDQLRAAVPAFYED